MLQQTAWNQVKDSSYVHGYDKINQFHTDFSIESDSFSVTVIDSSSSMINKKMIYWGDGDSSLITPVLFQDFNKVTHNYSQVGNYTITQKVWWSECDSGEVIKNISLPLSINEIDNNPNLFFVYPNPANNLIEIKSTQSKIESIQLQIFDTHGRLIMSNQESPQNGQLTIDLSSIPNQLLFLKITDTNGVQQTLKVVKE
jgi:Secretion system C-terminal sorting domain